MTGWPSLIRHVTPEDAPMLEAWRWRVPQTFTPLFITVFGDWVFGAPDGSLHSLDMLEGLLSQVASNAGEYNTLKSSEAWLDERFVRGWFVIALGIGLVPSESQCLGWGVHPLLGGPFEKGNLRIFSMTVYQSLMSQLHRHLQKR